MKNQNILTQNGVDLTKGLELFGDIEMYNESLGDFMAEVDGKLYKIAHFKETNDMPNYAILVHSLKSDAKYFGFTKLAEFSYAHELEAKANNTVFVNENYESLMTEANRIVAMVKEYLNSNTTVPTVQVSVADTPSVSVQEPPIPIDQNMKSILVVDDSEIINNFVHRIFTGIYNVLTALDGAEAIKIIESTPGISAMLLDLNMPNVDGFKVLEYMKEKDLFKILPVSIITGNDSKEIDQNAFAYPIIDILKKPFTDSSIKTIVERTMGFQ